MSKTRLYKIWKGMNTRCYNSHCKPYKNYGGRGIKICDRWLKFENFRDDMISTYRNNLSIERINNDGDYEANNCRWITLLEQVKNKRMQKLNKDKVKEIRLKYKFGNGKFLAKEYGVCPAVISEVVNYKRNYANC